MTFIQFGGIIGGLGLFLLGMALLTDGLKTAAGSALRDILARWTRARWQRLLTGFSITALVQSSSAVTVAVIGFVNAGLLTLSHAVWVVFGANVGTTMTAWIVSLIGLKLNIEAIALPIIGIGVALRIFTRRSRYMATGDILAGFGLFFLGLSILSETFSGLSTTFDLGQLATGGILNDALFVGIGFLVTLATQSSSASIAIALTAASGSLIPLEAAAAMVIGANLGTTSTSLFAVIGATPNAKRVAVSHVMFNVLTGLVALAFLPGFLSLVEQFGRQVGLSEEPAVLLALFHTFFNVVGVLLMAPITPRLVRWLHHRFTTTEEDLAIPKYLDKSGLEVPALAANSIYLEMLRLNSIACLISQAAISRKPAAVQEVRNLRAAAAALSSKISGYLSRVYAIRLSAPLADALAHPLRAILHIEDGAELAEDVADGMRILNELPEETQTRVIAFSETLSEFIDQMPGWLAHHDETAMRLALENLSANYSRLKQRTLIMSAEGLIRIRAAEQTVQLTEDMRQIAIRHSKTFLRIENLFAQINRTPELPESGSKETEEALD